MRFCFLTIILIANPVFATINSGKQSIPTKDITIGPPPGIGRYIRQAQAQAFLDNSLKYSPDGTHCMYGTIVLCTTTCIGLALYAALTKMSMSIY